MRTMRLIDADALAAEILDTYGSDAGSGDVAVIYGMVINAPGIEVVDECPSDWDSPEDEIYDTIYSDPQPKTGKWIKVHGYYTPGGDPVWACSECGKGIHVYGIEHGSYGSDVSDGQWKACPNCGCRMTEE